MYDETLTGPRELPAYPHLNKRREQVTVSNWQSRKR